MADKKLSLLWRKNMQNQSDFKILSLSGGGYRGLYTAEVLKRVGKLFKK